MHTQNLIDLVVNLVLVIASWPAHVIAELILHLKQLLLELIHIVLLLESITNIVGLLLEIVNNGLWFFKILNCSCSYRLFRTCDISRSRHEWSRWIFEYSTTATRWRLISAKALYWRFWLLWLGLLIESAQKSQGVGVHCYLVPVIVVILHFFRIWNIFRFV